MTAHSRVLIAVTALALLAISFGGGAMVAATAAESAADHRYLRIVKDDRGRPLTMETAIVRCAPKDASQDAPTVDLVGAVHVAEKSYYDRLNKEFADYDVVLYELVAPKGTRIVKGERRGGSHPISLLQQGMKDILRLEFQLECIDYSAKNFVHADMSPEQFAASMKNRNESLLAMFLRVMGYAMSRQQGGSGGGEAEILMALLDRKQTYRLKRVLAEQFEDMEGSLQAIEGPDGSTLIAERNKLALGVLKEQLAKGKKKVAIFYGAGHLSDFVKRLGDDFGLAPKETRWLAAWDLTPPGKAAAKDLPARETPAKDAAAQ